MSGRLPRLGYFTAFQSLLENQPWDDRNIWWLLFSLQHRTYQVSSFFHFALPSVKNREVPRSFAAMDWMLSYQCKGRTGKFETFPEVFRTGLILAGPALGSAQLSCFVHMIIRTRFNWRGKKWRGMFQQVWNYPGFVLGFFCSYFWPQSLVAQEGIPANQTEWQIQLKNIFFGFDLMKVV